MWCFKDGEFVRAEDLRISPFDHGYLYGLGFFETFRTYNGEPFLFAEHMQRMRAALATYRIQLPYTDVELKEVIRELTAKSNGEDGYFRLNVSAGDEGLGLQARTYENPTVIIFRKELPPVCREKSAVWLDTIRSQPEQTTRFKSHHYANNILARQEVPSLKDLEGFYVTEQGNVAEGITSNIFWATNGRMYTPSLETGILNGITRQFIMELARSLEIPLIEGLYRKEDVEQADECFVTTSIQEIVAIRKLGAKEFKGCDGEVYQQLYEAYQKRIEGLRL